YRDYREQEQKPVYQEQRAGQMELSHLEYWSWRRGLKPRPSDYKTNSGASTGVNPSCVFEHLDERNVRRRAFHFVAMPGERHEPALSGFGQNLRAEARLADARLTANQDQRTVTGKGPHPAAAATPFFQRRAPPAAVPLLRRRTRAPLPGAARASGEKADRRALRASI